LDALETLKGRQVDLDELSKVLASARGMTLGITLAEKPFGKIKLDFGQDASLLKDFAKPLLLEALANHGAMIDEFQEWTVRVNGKQVTLEGNLYQSGLQRLSSLLDAPPELQEQASAAASGGEGQTEEDLKRLASQQYFNSVTAVLEDLRRRPERSKISTWGQVGVWMDSYARKLDGLPILNVDPELLDYGAYVANSFRASADSLKGIGAKTRVREVNQPTQYNTAYRYGGTGGYGRYGGYGGYGGYAWASWEDTKAEQRERTRIRTEERIAGTASAQEIMGEVAKATAEVRRKMTEKYQVEF
jgi:hypothetical protein